MIILRLPDRGTLCLLLRTLETNNDQSMKLVFIDRPSGEVKT